MSSKPYIILTVFILLLLSGFVLADDFHLEQLHWITHDTTISLMRNVYSPGDLNGDDCSEIFVQEYAGLNRELVFSGNNMSHNSPLRSYEGLLFKWIDDINGDGLKDFIVGDYSDPNYEQFHILYGCEDFLSKENYDVTISLLSDTIYNYGVGGSEANLCAIYSGDIDGDNYNDLIVPAAYGDGGLAGRFVIYNGGSEFDIIPDQILTFTKEDGIYDAFISGTALGDINGDGLTDLGFTVWSYDLDYNYVAVILGKTPLDTIVDIVIPSPFLGQTYDILNTSHEFGELIKPMGDLNHDGYDDFVVGGSAVWATLYYGGDPFVANPIVLGDTTTIYTGDRVANIGDINNDGWDDI